MTTLAKQVRDDLAADDVLTSYVADRIYHDRVLKKAGVRATPEAFDANGMVKRSIVLVDDGMIGDLGREDAGNATLTIWLHGPDTDRARQDLDGPIYERVIATVLDGTYVVTNGTGVEIGIGDRFGLRGDPTIENAVVDYIRCTVARLWR